MLESNQSRTHLANKINQQAMSKKIATLWDKDKSDEPDPQDGQAFYAGGSEHSGQQILGPSSNNPDRLVSDLFQHAAQQSQTGPTDTNGPSITFWRNGFTVGDGELRYYQDPGQRRFLETIKRGDTPPELSRAVAGAAIDLHLINKAHEDYKPVNKPFSGQGHRLGP